MTNLDPNGTTFASYVGGRLFERVEKAHSDVFNVLQQVLDHGQSTDGHGRTVDFRQTLVLMTSNLRSDTQLRDFFRPEFINRVDEVVAFHALAPEQMGAIVEIQLKRQQAHLAAQDIQVGLTNSATAELATEGYDPEFGARPLERVIQKRVENLLADSLLRGTLPPGSRAPID